VPLAEHDGPRDAGLKTLETQPLVHGLVVGDGPAPLKVVVALEHRVAVTPTPHRRSLPIAVAEVRLGRQADTAQAEAGRVANTWMGIATVDVDQGLLHLRLTCN